MKNMMNFYLIWKYFAASIFFLMLSNNVFSRSIAFEPGGRDKSISIVANSSDKLAHGLVSKEILFFDGNVSDINSLISGIHNGIEIIRLDKSTDGVQQITNILKNRHDLTAIHIVSHGSTGLIRLGNASLSSHTIDNYSSQLTSWGQSLTETGDLLLYGCNVAQGKSGHDFINELSQLTGADVAASEDVTGASVLGGNWELEAINSGGELKASSLNLKDYPNLLAVTAASITSITTDTGISSADFITSDQTLIFGGLYTSGGGTNNLYLWVDNVYKGAITVSANQTNVAWTYNYTATTLTSGTHVVVINTSNTVIATGQFATKTITVDTAVPSSLAATPLILTPASNSGSLLDNITNVNKPVVSLNLSGVSGLSAGETVQIIDASNGNLVVGSYTILASDLTTGTWNRTTQNITLSTLALGVHNLTANIIDVAGNTGVSTAQLALTIIDQTAPIPNKASAGGNILTLAFTETGSGLKSTSVPLTSNFVLTQSGLPISVTAVAVNSTTNEITLTLGASVSTSVNALLSYTPSGTANDIQDVSLNKVVAFSGFYVSTSLPVYNVNNNPLLFNSSTAKVGTGKANGDIVLFDHIITINGQAIDAIITTVALTSITINGYETGVSSPVNTNFFETDMQTTAAGGNAEFRIDFIKNGTYNATTHAGSGVILQNVSLNSWDIDAAGAGQYQFQEFGGFAQYTVATNTSLNQTNMGSNFVHFQNTDGVNDGFNATIAANGSATSDKYRVKALYAAISSFGIKMGDVANSSTVYFYLDFSPGPAFASGKTYVEPTVNPATTADTTPTLTGTYGNSVAGSPGVTVTSMSVKVNGVTYTTASGLVYSNGNWTLTTNVLPNGIYDVVAWVTYSDGSVLYDPTFSELVIDTSLGMDNTPPTLTSIERFNPAAQSVSSSDLLLQGWVEFKLTFSEPVTQNITADDFQTSGLGGVGTLISQVTQIGASVYTIRVSNIPSTDWDYLGIDLAATNNLVDNSGNLLTNLLPTSGIDEVYLWANQAPIAVNDVATTTEDTPVSFNVTTNDYDTDGTVNVTTVDLDTATAGIQTTFTVVNQGTYAVNSSGLVTFTPVLNFNGTATAVNYTVQDNKGVASNIATITVTVTPVNDVPSFTVGADQTICVASGAQTVNSWATAISSGPANESSQSLLFNITSNSNSAIFSVQPSVSSSGVLTFTPNSTSGSATIALNIQDNGGTANGGVDKSADQTFTITVNAAATVNPGVTLNTCQSSSPTAITLSGASFGGSASTAAWSISTGGGTLSSIAQTATPAAITYTPAANFSGTVTLILTTNVPGICPAVNATRTINVNALPAQYSVSGGGAYCSGSGGLPVGLSGSQVGVNYQLQINAVNTGSPIAGTGSVLSFGNKTVAGTYTVVATNTFTGCTANMSGNVNLSINPLPVVTFASGVSPACAGSTGNVYTTQAGMSNYVWTVSAGGTITAGGGSGNNTVTVTWNTSGAQSVSVNYSNVSSCSAASATVYPVTVNALPNLYFVGGGGSYCTGGTGVSIITNSSQVGINYQLKLGGSDTGSPLAGTGSGLNFGLQTIAGNYTVVGTNSTTGCTSNMTGSADITINPLPAVYNVTGGGNYCNGGSGVAVGLSNSQTGVNYQLKIGATNAGIPLAGTGSALSFGLELSAGTYTVVATNPISGCSSNMSGTAVVIIDPIPVVTFSAGVSAACVGSTGNVYTTQSGMSSYLWMVSGGGTITSGGGSGNNSVTVTWNTAGPQSVSVIYMNVSGCVSASATIYPVTVNASPVVYNVTGGGPYCSGGSGVAIGLSDSQVGVNYQLQLAGVDNGGLIAGTGNAIGFGNKIGAGIYTVTAINASTGCTSNMSGSATVSVNPLPALYTVTGGGTDCTGGSGVVVGLSGSQTGVTYQLRLGVSDSGSPVTGTGSAISFGNKTVAGTYTVVATNTSTTCSVNMSGNVTITLNPLPTVYNVTGGGSYCSGGTGVLTGLSNSQVGVNYQLKIGGVNTGSSVAGTAGAISFGLQTAAGIYTVVGINAITSCSSNMNNSATVSINPLPTAYNVTGGGSFCSGGSGLAVGLSNSQSGVNYQLQLNSINSGSPIAGTGGALSFGTLTAAGGYTVVATNTTTGCTANMTGSVTITVNALPTVYIVTGGGSYCSGGSGVAVGLSGSQNGVNYQLQLGAVNTGSPVSGTGSSISFGAQTSAGTYSVIASNASTGCTSTMTGTAIVTINPLPTAYIVTGGGTYCSGGSGAAVGLNNSQTGVNYQLQLGGVNDGSALAGNGSALSFGVKTATGTYTVVATTVSTGCTSSMTGSVSISTNPLPTIFNATGGGTDCSGGSGVIIGLSGSQTGVNYQLHIGGVNTGLPISGTGSALNFGAQVTAGTYTIEATNASTGCIINMNGNITVTVTALPLTYNVTGGGSYCSGGSGVIVGLSNSQVGVNYQLRINGSDTGSPVSGTASAISFGSQSTAGTYTVVATNASTSCNSIMTGSVSVSINPLPTIYTVTGGGSFCSGGSGVALGLSNSQTGINYQLHIGGVNTGLPIAGTGSAISFGSQLTAGTYTIEATNASTGCISNMTGTASVTVNPLPTVTFTAGVASACAGSSGNVYTTQAGMSNYDWIVSAGGTITSGGGIGNNSVTVTWNTAGSQSVSVNYDNGNACTAITPAIYNVTVSALPLSYNVTGGGSFCTGALGVAVGLSNSQTGVNYQLQLVGVNNGSPVTGTGSAISFGNKIAAGLYTVVATNTSSSCTSNMTGSATITVNPLPVVTFTGGPATVCEASTGNVYTTQGSMSNYQWNVSAGGTITSGGGTGNNSVTVTWDNTGAQSVSVNYTNGNGCTAAIATNYPVTVNPLPTMVIASPATCSLNLLTYSVSVTVSSGTVTSTSGAVSHVGNLWTVSAVPTGTNIILTLTDAVSCATTLSITAPDCSCPVISAPLSGGDKEYCVGSSVPAITASVSSGITVDWYNVPSGGTALATSTLSYTPASAGVYYAEARNSTTNCKSSTRTSITINSNPVTGATSFTAGATTVCQDAADETYTATAANNTSITYSVSPAGAGTISSSTGILNWSALFSGTATVRATATGLCGTSFADRVVIVNPTTGPTTFTAGAITECQDAADETYTATAANNTSITYSVSPAGAGTINSTTGVMNWSALFSGTATITATANGLCGITHADRAVPVNPTIGTTNFTAGSISECQDAPDETYTATAANSTSISYSVSPAGAGTINSSTGVMNWSASFSGTATVRATAIGLCGTSFADRVVTVNPSTGATSFTAGAITLCQDAADETYTATAANSTSISYSVLPAGAGTINSSTGVMNWSPSFSGTATVRATANGLCGTSFADRVVIVNPTTGATSFTAGAITECQDAVDETYSATAANSTSISYSVLPAGAGTINSSTGVMNWSASFSGTATITATATGLCGTTQADRVVTVNPATGATSFTAGSTSDCQDAADGTYTATAANSTSITYSVLPAGAGTINSSTGVMNWSPSFSGTATITATATGLCGTTQADRAVTVNPTTGITTFTAGAIVLCQDATDETYTATSANSTSITYSVLPAGAGTINSSTGVMNWSALFSGTATITATASGSCGTTHADRLVTVNPTIGSTSFTAGAITECQDAADETYTATAANSTSITYSVSPAGAGTINSSTGLMNWSASFSGTATITANATGLCGTSSATRTVTVNPSTGTTSFTAGATTLCQNAADETYTAISANSTAITYSVSPAGAGTINSSTGVMNWSASYDGIAIITATSTGLCGTTSATQSVTINKLPGVIAGSDRTICNGSSTTLGALPVSGSTYSWTSSPLGFTSSLANPTVSPSVSTSYTVVETITATGCSDSQSVLVNVNPLPVVSAPASVCVGSTITLSPVTGGTWSSSNNAVATVTNAGIVSGISSGTVNFTFTNTITGCSSTTTSVSVNQEAVFTTCPSDILQHTELNLCSAMVSYSAVTSGVPDPDVTYLFTGATTGSGAGSGSGSVFNTGVTTVVITATNTCGTKTCSFNITIRDNEIPVIICPANITQTSDAGVCGAAISITNPTATDNCSVSFIFKGVRSDALALNDVYPVGTTTISWTATDAALNTSLTCDQIITVTDDEKPVIICPDNILQTADAGICGAAFTVVNPTATDNCSTSFTFNGVRSDALALSAVYPVGITTITWTATDAALNTSASCSQTVTITDDEKPVITCPDHITQNTDAGACQASVTITPPKATDNCSSIFTFTGVRSDLLALNALYPTGNTTITWTATDAAGNTSLSCDQTISVTDHEKPVISCPANIAQTNDAGVCGAALTITDPTATDNCSTSFIFAGVRSDALPLSAVYPVGITTINWTATDVSGNTSLSCNQTVTVTDNEKPVIVCPANIIQTADAGVCGASVSIDNPTATDNCSTSFSFSGVRSDALALSAVYPVGITTIQWTATDLAGNTSLSCNQTVRITDDEKPVISCPENMTLEADAGACGASVTVVDPTATDNCSSSFTFIGVRSDLLALNALYPVGNTTITWTVKDASGNSSLSCDQSITVTDHEKPLISCPVNINQTADAGVCGAALTLANPTATDNCSTSFTFAGVRSDALALSAVYPVGITTITWTATDASGNTSLSCNQTVTITDHEKPTIVCKSDIIQTSDVGVCGASVFISNPTATDNCSSSFIFAGVRSDALTLLSVYPVGITTITWTATDLAGNTSLSCNQTVTITDDEKPVITCPAQITLPAVAGVCGASVTIVNPTVTDNCPASISVIGVRSDALALSAVYPVGTTTITWTATDAAGNISENCIQNVKVTDNEKPVAICKNVTLNLDESGNATLNAGDINNGSTDNCGIKSVVASKTSFTCSDIGANHVTLTVTDNSDNFSSCDATVTVTDTNAPVLSIGNISVHENDGNAVFTVSLSNPRTCDVSFTVNTADNTALSTSDYTSINNVVYTIPGGSSSVTVSVPITNNTIYEPTENFYVNLSNPDHGTIPVSQGICTILDDDAPPSVTIADASATEGSNVIFPVTLSNPSSEAITLTFGLTNGTASNTDYNTSNVTVTIPAGSVSINVVVPTIQDLIDEKDETFTIAVKSVDSGTAGNTSDTATGTIIDDENYPVAADDSATTLEDTPITIDVLVNDIFGDDGPSTGRITANNGLHGTVYVNDGGTPNNPADDKVVYSPNADYNGYDSFTYSICDPTPDCSVATVTVYVIPVNDLPFANDDLNTTLEDTPLIGADVTVNDVPSGDGGNVWSLVGANGGAIHGSVTMNSNGTYNYIPNANYHGSDSFTYQLCDIDGDCDQAIVNITITAVNDFPVAVNDVITTLEDVPIIGASVTVNDIPSGDGGNVWSLVGANGGAANGTVTMKPDGTYDYMPKANFNGTDYFIYQLCDSDGDCDQARVTIFLSSVNNIPLAEDDVNSTLEDTPIIGATVATNDIPSGDGGNKWSLFGTFGGASHGKVTMSADGKYNYTPDANFTGTDTFIYLLCDIDNDCAGATVQITVTPVNDPPVAIDDINTTFKDMKVSGNVLTNDNDPDGNLITIKTSPVTGPANGSVTISLDGTYTYTPVAGFSGTDSFVYEICDNGIPSLCDQAKVTIKVIDYTGTNNAPVAMNDAYQGSVGLPVNGNVISNDFDPDGNLNMNSVTVIGLDPSNGSFTMNANGIFNYIPNAGFIGQVSFNYRICDLGSPPLCDIATVTIDIKANPDKNSTFATDDSYFGKEDKPMSGNVLTNDNDPQGDKQTVNTTPIISPKHGTLVLNSNGTFIYNPVPNYFGTDQFVYQVCDNGTPQACDQANVYLIIAPQNDPPVAEDDINTTFKNIKVSGNVLTNDSDPEGDVLTINTKPAIPPTYGTVVINPDGTYTYTPNSGFSGIDIFVYEVCDNGSPVLCDQAKVTIKVIDLSGANNAPVAINDDYQGSIGLAVKGNVISNDFDPDGNLNPNSVKLIGSAPASGVLTLNTSGTFTYVPASGFMGQVSFIYQICDLGTPALCDMATVTIEILANPNGNSTFATDDLFFGKEDNPIIGNVLTNDNDPQGDIQTVNTSAVALPAHGTLVLNANGTFTYTPVPNYWGQDHFVYEVCDSGTPKACDQASVYLIIAPQNNPPVAMDDINNTFKGEPVSGNVLTNDSDPDGNLLIIKTAPAVNPLNGTVVINPDGTYTYTPKSGFSGTDSFVYEVCDNGTPSLCDQAKVTIKVIDLSGANNPPVAMNDAYQGSIGLTVKGNVISNDFDPDGNLNPNSVTLIGSAPASGTLTLNANGTFTYIPLAGFLGQVNFQYQVCDLGTPALCDIATVTIEMQANPIGNSTFATDDSFVGNEDSPISGNVLTNDYDPQGDVQKVNTSPLVSPSHGTLILNSNGTFKYVPVPNYNGTDHFAYEVCDNGAPTACDQATVYLIIKPFNDAPIAKDDIAITFKDKPVSGNLLTNDSDPEGDPLSIKTNPVSLPAHGVVIINPDGTYTYTPNSGFIGNDSFVYEVCDNGIPSMCNQATVSIKVIDITIAANSAPIANNDVYQGSVGYPVKGNVISNDFDPDGNLNPNSVTLLGSAPVNGSLTLNPNGTFTFIPLADFIGQVSFQYTVCDLGTPALCDVAKVTIDILPNPTGNSTFATDDIFFGREDVVLTGNVSTNDNDPEGNTQSVNTSPVIQPIHGALKLNSNGTFIYTPDANYNGLDRFVYEVCDNGMPTACDQATVYLILAPGNDVPVAVDDVNSTDEEVAVSGNVSTNDTPSSDGGNVWTIVSQPPHGELLFNPDGTYTYSPELNYNGIEKFIYKLCDIDGDCSDATVSITVRSINDLPVANDDTVSFHIDAVLESTVAENDILSGDGGNIWSIVTPPANGTLVFNTNGTYTYTPNLSFTGTDGFTYELCDANGDCDQAKVTITINDVIVVNQIFTPNGDGQNDTFHIEGIEFYPTSKLTIFNRWGNVVYQKSGYLNDWEGNSNKSTVGSSALSVGTYFYVLDYGIQLQKHKAGYIYLER